MGGDSSKLGSRFHPGEYWLNQIGDHKLYSAPLEFNDLRHFWTSRETPGYVVASATAHSDPPKLVKEVNGAPIGLRYLKSSWSIWNLRRHLYLNGYSRWHLGLFAFEVDDAKKPWWIVTLQAPTIQYYGNVIEGVLLIDPQSGAIQRFTLQTLPKWVDTVMDEDLARERANWYGRYPFGYVRSVVTGRYVMTLISHQDDRLPKIWDRNGQPFYLLDLNIHQGEGVSLAALLVMNCRTGDAREYLLSGSKEVAAEESLKGEISNYAGWHVSELTPVNLSGREVWSGPIISSANIFQRFGLVDVRLGIAVVGTDRIDAYRKLVNQWAQQKVQISVSGLIRRAFRVKKVGRDIVDGRQIYSLTDSTSDKVYAASSVVSSRLPLTEPGDEVEISFLKSDELLGDVIPILEFKRK